MRCEIIKVLFEIGALSVNVKQPFHYASGLKGPIYCDNRLIWSYPEKRKVVLNALHLKMTQSGLTGNSSKILGLATGGIAHGMWIADKLNLPFGYIRSQAKGHGKQKLLEGNFNKGDHVVLIEDLVNQGSSLEKALIHLQEQKITFDKCYCLISYESPNSKIIEKKYSIKIEPLITLSDLIAYLAEHNLMEKAELDSIQKWQNDPKKW